MRVHRINRQERQGELIWIKVYIMQADVRTAHDAICAADRTRTLVYRASRSKKDEDAELFVKMVKRLARGFGFKLCDRIKFEDPETGKKYV